MPSYQPPLRDMQFVMFELLGYEDEYRQMPLYSDFNRALADQVLEEGGKFASEVLFPINRSGDVEGCQFDPATGVVTTPAGFKEAYRQFAAAGWPSLGCATEYGGQGLPRALNNAFFEMLNASNQAWTMYPGLAHGAYECLLAHGTPEQRSTYLPRLVSGEWGATMCLTEAHCGTDLGLLRSRAVPAADGSYTLTGSKIFISGGEHDLTENIIHLVLARLPDAPAGTRGISLFVVPKFLSGNDGKLGARNGIRCGAIEHKMGIHGSSTCQINLDGASGWLLGEANKGLNAMFVMMNAARLGVGMQSLGLSEVAYQNAVTYARERLQSRSLSGVKAADKAADPIIVHADVRRMLLTARAWAEGGRMLGYFIAMLLDREEGHTDASVRKEAGEIVSLLTPVVKAFLTDNGFAATSEALQVYGGHGYISEWGMEQYLRDARINMIYEGTNTIQSLDLLGRKVLQDGGARLKKFGALIEAFVEEHGLNEAMQEFVNPLADLGQKVSKLTMELGMKALRNHDEVGAAAVPYLRIIGHLTYAWLFARAASLALAPAAAGEPFYIAKLATARFYFQRLLPETAMLIAQARSGADNLLALDVDLF